MSCDPFFNFDARNHVSRSAEARVAKFCMHVEYIKCLDFNDKLLSNGRGHVTPFFNSALIISLELVRLGISNFVC